MPFPGVNAYKGFKEERDQYIPLPERRRVKETDSVATLELSSTYQLPLLHGTWDMYRSWNVIQLLQNYLRYIFHLLRNGTDQDGLLVHCISGWDRTPMFIGILRILLWAEGLIHKSLDIHQILFLVIGYDWLLFGHQLLSRLKEGSQILYFAFWALQYLLDDEFSLQGTPPKNETKNPSTETKPQKEETHNNNHNHQDNDNTDNNTKEEREYVEEVEKPEKWLWIKGYKTAKENMSSPVISPRRKMLDFFLDTEDEIPRDSSEEKARYKKARSEKSSPRGHFSDRAKIHLEKNHVKKLPERRNSGKNFSVEFPDLDKVNDERKYEFNENVEEFNDESPEDEKETKTAADLDAEMEDYTAGNGPAATA